MSELEPSDLTADELYELLTENPEKQWFDQDDMRAVRD